jgi:hypothetical protein
MTLRRRLERLEERHAPPEAAPTIRIRQVIVPAGPCGYLANPLPAAEWAAWEAEHGAEAAARARRYAARCGIQHPRPEYEG